MSIEEEAQREIDQLVSEITFPVARARALSEDMMTEAEAERMIQWAVEFIVTETVVSLLRKGYVVGRWPEDGDPEFKATEAGLAYAGREQAKIPDVFRRAFEGMTDQ